jgi:hypothetical protein
MTVHFTKKDIEKSQVSEINPDLEFKKRAIKVKNGWVTIGDRTLYVRSSWENDIACYLEWLKKRGDILQWEYEPYTFWFLKIMRGVRSYKPDFKITRKDGSHFWIEVKGYMDPKSATKLKRMKKYHPKEHIQLIGAIQYKAISRSKLLFTGWGQLG